VEFLALVLDRSHDFVTIVSMRGELVYANRTVRDFFAVEVGHDLATLTAGGGFTDEARRTLREEVWPALRRDGTWTGELTLVNAAGDVVTLLQSSQLHRDDDGTPRFVSGIGRDVTDLKVAQERLAHLALHDPLTRLPNRAAVMDRLRAQELSRTRGAVLYIDIDGFKTVNDRYGHATGDAVLARAATRLRAAVRPDDLVGRVGGDEFVVVCEDVDGTTTSRVAERIVDALGEPFHVGEHLITVSASVGTAPLDDDGVAALALADAAMYDAKRNGGGRATTPTCEEVR
jgi:diguanylate cyclase (GGDEF)-like protein/PAS domain S-box-containing protein